MVNYILENTFYCKLKNSFQLFSSTVYLLFSKLASNFRTPFYSEVHIIKYDKKAGASLVSRQLGIGGGTKQRVFFT